MIMLDKYYTTKELLEKYNVPRGSLYYLLEKYRVKYTVISGNNLKVFKEEKPEINQSKNKLTLIRKKEFDRTLKKVFENYKRKPFSKRNRQSFDIEEKFDLLMKNLEEIKAHLCEEKTLKQEKPIRKSFVDIKYEKDQVLKLMRALNVCGQKQRIFYEKLEQITGEDLHERSAFERQIALTKGYSKTKAANESRIINIILEDDILRSSFLKILYVEEKRVIRENMIAA